MSHTEIIFIVCVLLFGGFVKGSIGFGMPVVAAPPLALVFAPQDVVTLLAVSLFVSNATESYRLRAEWRAIGRIWPYIAAGLAFVPVGIWYLTFGDPDSIRLMMGLMAYAYLIVETRLGTFRALGAALQKTLGALMGAALGFVYGTTTISGVINTIYFSMLGLAKNPFIFLMNIFNTAATTVMIFTLSSSGLYTRTRLTSALLAVLPTYLGYWVGVRIREHIDHVLFFRLIRIALFLIATSLVARFLMAKLG